MTITEQALAQAPDHAQEPVLANVQEVAALLDNAVPAAFRAATADGQQTRGNTLALTLSVLGGCLRQGVFRLAGVTPTEPDADTGENRAAHLGTWIHDGYMPYLAAQLGGYAVVERTVRLKAAGRDLGGRLDLFRQHGGIVVETKTAHSSKWSRIAQIQRPEPMHDAQLRGYALALAQEGEQVRFLVWVYINRDTGDTVRLVRAWAPEDSSDLVERVVEMDSYLDDPAAAPPLTIEGRLPPKIVCGDCPFLTACKGPGAAAKTRAPWTPRAYAEPVVWADLAEHHQLELQAKQAKVLLTEIEARQEVLRARFTTQRAGVPYAGPNGSPMQFTWSEPGPAYDAKANRDRFAEVRQRAAAILAGKARLNAEVRSILELAAGPEPRRPGTPQLYVKPAKPAATDHEEGNARGQRQR